MSEFIRENVNQGKKVGNSISFSGVHFQTYCDDAKQSCLIAGAEFNNANKCNKNPLFPNCDAQRVIQTNPNNQGGDFPCCDTGCYDLNRRCAYLDPRLCDLDQDRWPSQHEWANPLGGTDGGLSFDGVISCGYPLDIFIFQQPLERFIDKFTDSGEFSTSDVGSNLDTKLMPLFCGQKNTVVSINENSPFLEPLTPTVTGVTTVTAVGGEDPITSVTKCPIDIFNNFGDNREMMEECSFFKTTLPKVVENEVTPEDICTPWVTVSTDSVEDTILEYCDTHKTRDCLCRIPGELDPTFNKIINATSSNLVNSRGCWYKPCGSDSYLQGPSIEKQKKVCETEPICNVILNAIAKGNINLDDVKEVVNCNFANPHPSSPSSITTTDIIIAVVIFVVVIIIFVILIWFTSGPGKSKSK